MTLHILILLIFVKDGKYELVDFYKKHEIVNKLNLDLLEPSEGYQNVQINEPQHMSPVEKTNTHC